MKTADLLDDGLADASALTIRVLLVDDQPIVGEAIRRALLQETDTEFHYCADPRQALAVALGFRPTVIMQDLIMPNVSGLDLVRQYRADPVTARIPIIVLSSREEPLVKSDAFRAGANDYLVKLPDPIELVARIRYHSTAYHTQIQRDEAYRALRESQRRLMAAGITLAENEASYRLLADTATDIISRSDLDGTMLYLSPAIERVTGYAASELVGRNIVDIVHPDDAGPFFAHWARMIDGEHADGTPVEYRIRHKDGSWIYIEGNPTLVRGDNGRVLGIVDVSRDDTLRKTLETELRAARQEAEAAAAAKGEFLANMSHELRTPLTSIVGFTRLAAEQADLQGLTRTYVERVSEASRALLCTVNDILDFSKLEVGQVSFQAEPTSLAKLGRATLDLFMPQAGAKDLDLVLDCEPETGDLVISVDPDRIRQILLNLVGNAVKFTDAGSITLRTRYDRTNGMLSVEVIDTGPGIPPDRHDRLFKRFSQVDGSLTRSHGGTGLGLAICKGLVEAMGGEIGADSRVGEGSRFWFTIPAPLAAAAHALIDGPHADQPTFTGLRVLVVDDHPVNRELARLILAGIGAEVSEAADGEDAVQLASESPYDVILMDLRMPRLDGPGALHRIREASGPNDATPILAFTADADSETTRRLTTMGFQDVVPKPLEPGMLIAAVARATVQAVKCELVSTPPRSSSDASDSVSSEGGPSL
jgi:PAS domain S-box-containing protein